jgi:DNA repair exonuclease SbcCD ATPase subunit
MITFETIRYKNFLSSGNNFTEITLNTHTNNVIIGKNGAGKSTLLDALTFVLFNKPFRRINKPQLLNTINGKDCCVEVEFSVGKRKYKVIRGMKPNLFEVYIDGEMMNQDAATGDQQKFLEQNILKLNFKSFTQIVVLGSSTFVPFMQLPLASRREIIEDLLDIQVFSTMNTNLKDRMKQLNDDIRFVEKDVDLVKHRIEIQEDLIKELETQSDNIIADKKVKIDHWNKQSDELLRKNEEYSSYISRRNADLFDSTKLSNKYDNLKEFKVKFENKIFNLNKENKFYSENDSCPTCKQGLDERFKLDKIASNNNSIKETQDAWVVLEEQITEVKDQINEFKQVSADIQVHNNLIDKNNGLINHMRKQVKEFESEIQSILDGKNNSSKEQDQLNKLIEQKNNLEKVLATHKEDKDYYSVAANLLKDTGIKTRIIKRYLPVMNKLINQYLQQMDFFVNFTLSESFEETIKSRYRDDFSYSSFSEGEKSRIDIALMLTWRSVAKLKNSVDTNLLVLDEIFDSSLDSTGTDELSYILRNFSDDLNLFIISHREHMVEKFDRVLRFNKVKNFSKMEELNNAVEV